MKSLDPKKWNKPYAAHLLGRAGFGATPEQINATAAKPLNEVIDELFQPAKNPAPPSWVKPGAELKPDHRDVFRVLTDPEKRAYRKLLQRENRDNQRELTGWWLQLMITSPTPLREKMTLFWHGHFATSIRKVRAPYMMYRQNQTFREKGLGNWRELITAVSQDPAMLVYLDNTKSKAAAPNENYARELMELFTLGEGHYSEDDIQEAARALTGWMVAPKAYAFLDAAANKKSKSKFHDSGTKTLFGQTGNFDGNDVVRILLEQHQAARFIVAKLWTYFAYEHPEPGLIDALAEILRANHYELEPLLRAIFTSEAFYSQKAILTQIKSPTRWLVGSCVALGIESPNPGQSANALRSLGQELFAPPNVKGWDGGYAWITTASLTARYNLAKQIINHRERLPQQEGARRRFGPPTVDVNIVLPAEKRADAETAMNYLIERLYQAKLPAEERQRLADFFATQPPPADWTDAEIRNALHVMMGTPRYQLT